MDRVFALLEDYKVVSLDTARLQVTGEFEESKTRLWLSRPEGSASIVVGGADSALYMLRSTDLSLIRKYRSEGEIEFPGFAMWGYVYFYSKDGYLNGLRY
jgi:hypothetical protein